MRSSIFFIFLFVCSLSMAQQKELSEEEILQFKKEVKVIAASTSSIQSDFEQLKHLDFLSNDIKSSGKLIFMAPNRIKWEYITPFKYSVIFIQGELRINDNGKKSSMDIGASKMFKKMNTLIVNSIKGDMFQDEDFDIFYYKEVNMYRVFFTPKDPKIAQIFASFELDFGLKDKIVQQVKMVEPSGDYTLVSFSNKVLNNTINEEVFSY